MKIAIIGAGISGLFAARTLSDQGQRVRRLGPPREFKPMYGDSRICAVCGRRFHWRRKWRRNWNQVKYCSSACRKSGLTDVDLELEKTILRLLKSTDSGAGICPGQAARAMAGNDDDNQWRRLMEPARRAARRLAHQGAIVVLQNGKSVDPSDFKGPIRLKRIQS